MKLLTIFGSESALIHITLHNSSTLFIFFVIFGASHIDIDMTETPRWESVAPVTKFLKVPSGGPPVPAARLLGSFDKGHPNLASFRPR